jgi:peroxiredoxin
MVALETPMLEKGWKAADFTLKGVDGKDYDLNAVKGEKGLVVMFICNHCPFVKSIIGRLVEDVKKLQALGVGVVAIMSNDTENYPDDSYENMQAFAKEQGFTFPYVIDETQAVAKQYDAVCTPDFYGFDKDLALAYRGRFDSAGRNIVSDAEHELLEAMTQIAQTGHGPEVQKPSIGCSIKWRA